MTKTTDDLASVHITLRISEAMELEIREFIDAWNNDNSNLLPLDVSSLLRISVTEFIHNRKIIKKLGIK